jgi:hypothetical protein
MPHHFHSVIDVTKRNLVLKMAVFKAAAPFSLVSRPDDGNSKHLWNVGIHLPHYTEQYPRKQPSSYSSPWNPEISPNSCLFICLKFMTQTSGIDTYSDVINLSLPPSLSTMKWATRASEDKFTWIYCRNGQQFPDPKQKLWRIKCSHCALIISNLMN